MQFLAGALGGAVISAWLMWRWFHNGWLRSDWYDAWIDDAATRASRGELIQRDWR